MASEPGTGRGLQLLVDHLARGCVRLSEQPVPPSAVAGAEPEFEQQLEPAVVAVPVAVVESLPVVGIGAGLEQQPRERQLVRMRRGIALAAAKRPGQRGERRAEALPQVAGVRVRAVVEQYARRRQRVPSGSGGAEARVGEIQERLPAVGAALPVRCLPIAIEQLAGGGRLADRGNRVNRRGRELGMACEELPRPSPAPGVVVAVVETCQAEEFVDERVLAGVRLADRLRGRRARVALRELDVGLQLRPARKVERTRDDELRVGELEGGELGRAGLRLSEARMKLANDFGGAGIPGADGALKRPGAVLQLLEICVARKTAGWHVGLLSHWPRVRNLGRKGDRPATRTANLVRWASPFPRTGGALSAVPIILARQCGFDGLTCWRRAAGSGV